MRVRGEAREQLTALLAKGSLSCRDIATRMYSLDEKFHAYQIAFMLLRYWEERGVVERAGNLWRLKQ
jgi:hypothetical protein